MKKVLLQRAWQDGRATLGMLTILEEKHDPFFTLENPFRNGKPDDRIPPGVYTCKPYSGTKYKDVYEITGVHGRSAILFHWGNFERDTEGCILIGSTCGMLSGEPAVMDSKKAFDRFRSIVGQESFLLTVVDVGGIQFNFTNEDTRISH